MEPFPEELNRKLTLSQWILKFDKHLLSHPKFYENVKEYFYESYKKCSNLRKEFHNDFLPVLDSNLGFPSSKEFYKYEYFFKPLKYSKYDLANFYFYDDDINLFRTNNNSLSNINQKETNGNSNNDNNSKRQKNINNNNEEKDINTQNKNNNKINSRNNKYKYNKNNDSQEIQNNEISSFENKNSNEKINMNKRKSYKSFKSDSNYSIKGISSIKDNSKYIENENEESARDSLTNNNMETYGKIINDKDDYSESKSKIFESSKSIKNNENNNNNVINKKELKKINIPINETKKPYLSRRFKNFRSPEPNHKNYKEDNKYNYKSFKDLNINKQVENDANQNNKENKLNIVSKLKQSKSNYDLFKKFSYGKY